MLSQPPAPLWKGRLGHFHRHSSRTAVCAREQTHIQTSAPWFTPGPAGFSVKGKIFSFAGRVASAPTFELHRDARRKHANKPAHTAVGARAVLHSLLLSLNGCWRVSLSTIRSAHRNPCGALLCGTTCTRGHRPSPTAPQNQSTGRPQYREGQDGGARRRMADKAAPWDSLDWYTKRVLRAGAHLPVSKPGVSEVRAFTAVLWRGQRPPRLTHRGQCGPELDKRSETDFVPGSRGDRPIVQAQALTPIRTNPCPFQHQQPAAQGSPVGEKRSEVTLISGLKCRELMSPEDTGTALSYRAAQPSPLTQQREGHPRGMLLARGGDGPIRNGSPVPWPSHPVHRCSR